VEVIASCKIFTKLRRCAKVVNFAKDEIVRKVAIVRKL